MADKNIGSLPNLADVQDDALLVVEFGGEAYHLTGAQWKAFAVAAAKLQADRAEAAAVHQPVIQNGTWWTWDKDKEKYVDSGLDAKGKDGYTPVKGKDYFDGEPGKDGYTPVKGKDYFDGEPGKDGYTPVKGIDYFDGAPGERGTGILKVTTAPSSYDTAIGDYIPKYRIKLSTVKSQSKVDEVKIGDIIQYSYYQYQIDYLSATYAYISAARVSLRGAAGSAANVTAENIEAALGYTPGERTHWKEVESGVVLFQKNDVSNTAYFLTEPIGLEVGGLYTVVYKDAMYDAIGVPYDDGSATGVILAKHDEYDRDQNDIGLLFAFTEYDAATAAATGVYGAVIAMDGSTSATLIITGDRIIYHKLDRNFLPGDLGGVKTVNGVQPDEEGNVQIKTGGVTDYNKLENRPFGSNGVQAVEILPETTVELDPDEGMGALPDFLNIESGKSYAVKWNGTEYVCPAQDYVIDNIVAGYALGDLGLVEGGASTGEPFVVLSVLPEMVEAVGVPTAVFALDGSTSVTLSIAGGSESIDRMEGKYLPKGTPYLEPFDDVIMGAFPEEYDSESKFFAARVGKVIPGDVYNVNWGGTIYECVAREFNVIGVILGRGDTGQGDGIVTNDPFQIIIFSPELVAQTGANGVIRGAIPENGEFSITGAYKTQKMSPLCLPENSGPLLVPVTLDGSTVTADMSYGEVRSAFASSPHRMVYLAEGLVQGTFRATARLYALCETSDNAMYFQNICFIDGVPRLRIITWEYDDTITHTEKRFTKDN